PGPISVFQHCRVLHWLCTADGARPAEIRHRSGAVVALHFADFAVLVVVGDVCGDRGLEPPSQPAAGRNGPQPAMSTWLGARAKGVRQNLVELELAAAGGNDRLARRSERSSRFRSGLSPPGAGDGTSGKAEIAASVRLRR